jgi:hypothetical protein
MRKRSFWVAGFLLIACLTSCGKEANSVDSALIDYTCSKTQMEKAQGEAVWCIKNTDFYKSYCYGSSVIRNCDLKNKGVEKK